MVPLFLQAPLIRVTHRNINTDLNWNLIETLKSEFLGLICKLDLAARLHQSLNIPLGPQLDSSDRDDLPHERSTRRAGCPMMHLVLESLVVPPEIEPGYDLRNVVSKCIWLSKSYSSLKTEFLLLPPGRCGIGRNPEDHIPANPISPLSPAGWSASSEEASSQGNFMLRQVRPGLSDRR